MSRHILPWFRSLPALALALALAPHPAPAQEEAPPPEPAAAQEAAAAPLASSSYRLSANDTVLVTVFREPELATSARISSDGTIDLPLLGPVRIAGRTVREATEEIRARLDAEYLVSPQVTVTVVDITRQEFTVLGQVRRAGSFELPVERDLTLIQAIGMAGGYARSASPSRITVRRSDGQETIRVDGRRQGRPGEGELFLIQPGDIITVPESIF